MEHCPGRQYLLKKYLFMTLSFQSEGRFQTASLQVVWKLLGLPSVVLLALGTTPPACTTPGPGPPHGPCGEGTQSCFRNKARDSERLHELRANPCVVGSGPR